ncbi:MAG: hypothetical protein JNK05_02335 [Myxococcales bacterium]|nr:hypothetical protein [Myxococcales bacterium]
MLTAPTWTYSAAGGPNPFIVPARGGFIATAINTESGATIVGLGRRATRFARPLKLEPRGVAIFAQPSPFGLPSLAWVVGYSTTAGVTPRLIAITSDGEISMDVSRPELGWRDGRAVAISETEHGPVLHLDDRHLVLDAHGDVVADLARPALDAPYFVEGRRLFAFDGTSIACVDLVTGAVKSRIPVDGRPTAIRVDGFERRLAIRLDRVLCSLDVDDASALPRLRAFVGGLASSPNTADSNLRLGSGPPAKVECLDDDGVPRWSATLPSSTSAMGAGFFVGGEALVYASHAGGERVYILRDGEPIFERARAGQPVVSGALARIGDRAAIVVAPGAPPSEVIDFSTSIEIAGVRGGGAVAFERPSAGGTHPQRMVAVDAAGARVIEISDGGSGARWAAVSDGLVAVPRTNAARVDLYDTGAPA